jgi:uncharacterized membrane protein
MPLNLNSIKYYISVIIGFVASLMIPQSLWYEYKWSTLFGLSVFCLLIIQVMISNNIFIDRKDFRKLENSKFAPLLLKNKKYLSFLTLSVFYLIAVLLIVSLDDINPTNSAFLIFFLCFISICLISFMLIFSFNLIKSLMEMNTIKNQSSMSMQNSNLVEEIKL